MADTTTTLREAAQRLLNAIEAVHEAEKSEGHARGGFVRTAPTRAHQRRVAEAWHENAAAVQALRAALAEQAAEQEVPGCWRLVGSDDGMRHPEACDLVGGETDMPAEQAEPVAWMDPATLDVIHAERKRAWSENYGQGGKTKAATYTVPLHAAPPAPARQEPLADLPPNEKLLALADRIDHEKLWSRAGLERPDWTQEQHDRCDAGVHLRRYAALLGQDWWRIYPPRGSNSFCSETLDGAVRLARKHERMFPAAPITAAPAEGGA